MIDQTTGGLCCQRCGTIVPHGASHSCWTLGPFYAGPVPVDVAKLKAQLAEAKAVLNLIQFKGSAGACPYCYEFPDESESSAKIDRDVGEGWQDAKNVRALKGHADCRLAKVLGE